MAQLPSGPLRRPQQHEEIADYLRDEIFAGHIPAGESLPSEVELCEQFNTSRGPVRQAVATLRAEGLLSSGRGRRSLVLSNTRTETFEEILSNTSWIYRMGKNPGQRVDRFEMVTLSPEDAAKLGLTEGERALVVERTHTADDEPVVYETLYFHPDLADAVREVDTEDQSIHRELVRGGVDFNNISRAFTIEQADAAVAERLEIAQGAPYLKVEIKALTHNGTPMEYAVHRYRADQLSFGLNNVRGHSSPLWFEIESHIH
ncbi:hypothetical protein A0K93_11120 [Corynebacterium sp. BCW_4722]|nr:hypothetical protein A0K93_11120 [Corynebacterium sp. BCW_4722]